ncbi:MAG: hypothetical protein A3G93_11270 [Nitrospinae bacterium RIFCSPLOWO2_12_FULL_45_22]|nr:MAG: hypothetical protein A3G93_11270 [Nitrospinae bacterium RIFCSPLOWO2_12_FULL_45_22]
MKVLFIYPDIKSGNFKSFHFGIGSIAAVLKEAGHEVSLLYLQDELKNEELVKRVKEVNPGLIAFSTGTQQWRYVKEYSQALKTALATPIICGGNHATLAPDEVIANGSIDWACVGEGELAMLELVARLEKGEPVKDIANIWQRTKKKVIKNTPRPLIDDLNPLPFPERDIFQCDKLLKDNGYYLTVMAGRGCPYACTYCCNPAFNRLYDGQGRVVRTRSPERVIEEITDLRSRYRIELIDFMDEVFPFKRDWLTQFCQLYSEKVRLPFHLMIRPEMAQKGKLKLLKEAGCEQVRIGVESGNEEFRRTLLNRNVSNKDIIKAFEEADKLGLKTYSFNIVGLPDETPALIRDTIALNKLIRPNHIQVSVFYPYPGTELYRLCQEKGYFTGEERTSFFANKSVLQMPTISTKEIARHYKRFVLTALLIKLRKEKIGLIINILKTFFRSQGKWGLIRHYYKALLLAFK